MRKLFIALLVSFPVLGIGQTDTENYVKSTAYRVATQDGNVALDNKQESVTYYDGLGRPKQSIGVRAGGQGENIVSYMEYDALGRTPKQYLPYATDPLVNNPLDFMDPVVLKANIGTFYNTAKYEDTQNPYSEMVYEPSPLNRVIEQAAPGNSWVLDQGHTIKMDYQSNTANEVRYFDVNFTGNDTENPLLVVNGHYTANELYKNITKDENWTAASGNNHTTEEFTNKQGQVVLKRTYDNNVPHDTYYVYDDFGNLTYVLSPEGSNQIIGGNQQEVLDRLCYQYKYDYRNRLIEKRIPGKGLEYIVYNKLDQPVLTQDAGLRENNQWLFTKYDALGRVAYTGMTSSSDSRALLQDEANDTNMYPAVYENRTPGDTNITGTAFYYSNDSFPANTITKVLTVNYYDDYIDTGGMQVPETVYNQFTTVAGNATVTTKGLPTVSKVRVLGTDDWITSITGYDEKGRAVYAETDNTYLETHDTAMSLYDFTGNVLESTSTHQKNGHQAVTTVDYFTYDHQNRLLTHLQQIDNEDVQLIASNSYDELGQLESKNVGGTLWEDGYTDVSQHIDISPEGVITMTSNIGWRGLSTIGVLDGNGGLSFTTLTNDKKYFVGLNDASNNGQTAEIDYGFTFASSSGTRYKVRVKEAGGSSIFLTPITVYEIGDTFAIEREDNDLYFYHNGSLVATHTMTQQYNTLVGDVSMRNQGASITDLNFYPTTIDKSLQKVDYQYNVRGWLTDINDVDSQSKELNLFNFHINYDSPVTGDAGLAGRAKPLYNGNISQTVWRTANPDDSNKRTYGYKYDALNRFKQGYSYKGNTLQDSDKYAVQGIDYDPNGNILNLTRVGADSNSNALAMDILSYHYNGNQLERADDAATSSINKEGFYDGNTSGDDYVYDINGNMIKDKNKGIASISYNHLNLPERVVIDTSADPYGQAQNGIINYVYDATGVKLAKILDDNNQGSAITTSYAGGYIYENNNGYEKLTMIAHPEGYVEPVFNTTKSIEKFSKTTQAISYTNYQYAFNYTDHLGNVRLTYADSDGDGAIEPKTEIISEKNYYPFGLQQKGYNDVITSNSNSMAERFGFGGKENNPELGIAWYDYGARNYDASLGRWMNIDPLAEQMRRHSTYNYAFDNPVFFIDPDGMAPSDRWQRGEDGSLTWVNNDGGSEIDYVDNVDADGNVVSMESYDDIQVTEESCDTCTVDHLVPTDPGQRTLLKAGASQAIQEADLDDVIGIAVDEGLQKLGVNPTMAGIVFAVITGKPKKRTSKDNLRRKSNGEPQPDPEASGTWHTQLGTANGRKGDYKQAREFDVEGAPVRDIDFTDHGRPKLHPNPHQHDYLENQTGGTLRRSKEAKPLEDK